MTKFIGESLGLVQWELETYEYRRVENFMLTQPHSEVSDPNEVIPGIAELDGVFSLEDYVNQAALPIFDASFSGQIKQLTEAPGYLGEAFTNPPQAYLLTANSAIPVADAIRGYFDELGIDHPYINYINTKNIAKKEVIPAGLEKETDDWSDNEREDWTNTISRQIQRLGAPLEGMNHVAVVDQFVSSGRTLDAAAQVLKTLGIPAVSGIRGRWYNGARQYHVNRHNVTSRHASFMHSIGVKACQQDAIIVNKTPSESHQYA